MSGDDVGHRNSMRYDFFRTCIPRERLAEITTQRVPLLYLEETEEFMPTGKHFTVNGIVRLITNLAKHHEAIREEYMEARKNISRGTATETETWLHEL